MSDKPESSNLRPLSGSRPSEADQLAGENTCEFTIQGVPESLLKVVLPLLASELKKHWATKGINYDLLDHIDMETGSCGDPTYKECNPNSNVVPINKNTTH